MSLCLMSGNANINNITIGDHECMTNFKPTCFFFNITDLMKLIFQNGMCSDNFNFSLMSVCYHCYHMLKFS